MLSKIICNGQEPSERGEEGLEVTLGIVRYTEG